MIFKKNSISKKWFTLVEMLVYLLLSSIIIIPLITILIGTLKNLWPQYNKVKVTKFVQEQLQKREPYYVFIRKYDSINKKFVSGKDWVIENAHYNSRPNKTLASDRFSEPNYGDTKNMHDLPGIIVNDLDLGSKYDIQGLQSDDVYFMYYTINYLKDWVELLEGVTSFKDGYNQNRTCFFGQSYDINTNEKIWNSDKDFVTSCILWSLYFIQHSQSTDKSIINDSVYILWYSAKRSWTDYKNIKMLPLIISSKNKNNYY